MGNNLNNDKNLKICVVLDDDIYYAGDTLTGTVYIRITSARLYQYLYLSLIGSEYVYWSQQQGKYSVSYSQEK